VKFVATNSSSDQLELSGTFLRSAFFDVFEADVAFY